MEKNDAFFVQNDICKAKQSSFFPKIAIFDEKVADLRAPPSISEKKKTQKSLIGDQMVSLKKKKKN